MAGATVHGDVDEPRLTSFAHGGGCACKIPPGELEGAVGTLAGQAGGADARVLVGLDDGADAAAVLVREGLAAPSTAQFLTPAVGDGLASARSVGSPALCDVLPSGGDPVV